MAERHKKLEISLEKLKQMIDEIPDISDEELLVSLVKKGSFDAIGKFLLKKRLSFEAIQKFQNPELEQFLDQPIFTLALSDVERLQSSDFKKLTDSEKKEILKDLIRLSKKDRAKILEKLTQLKNAGSF
ncbi:MAG: hypothetical protein ACTSRS_12980 [Candidatus Helarchaeota archaeon]